MTRSTKTAAAAPAPRNGRNGKVRTVHVAPADLPMIDAAAPTLALPERLAAALATAQASQQARQTRKTPTPRVALTAAELQAMEAMGWPAPAIDAGHTAKPQPRKRLNACRGGAAYDAAVAILTAGETLTMPELAALWLATGNPPKPYNAIAQQLANRAGRTIKQNGATLTLAA